MEIGEKFCENCGKVCVRLTFGLAPGVEPNDTLAMIERHKFEFVEEVVRVLDGTIIGVERPEGRRGPRILHLHGSPSEIREIVDTCFRRGVLLRGSMLFPGRRDREIYGANSDAHSFMYYAGDKDMSGFNPFSVTAAKVH